MKQMLTIAKQVLLKNLKSWGFYSMIFGPIIFFVIFILVGRYFEESETFTPDQTTVALVTNDNQVADLFEPLTNEGSPVKFVSDYESLDEAKTGVQEAEIDGILEVEVTESDVNATLYHDEGELSDVMLVAQDQLTQIQMLTRASNLGLEQADMAQIMEPVTINEEEINVASSDSQPGEETDFIKIMVAYVINFALFFFILFYSGMITEEIATEKGSRVMEVILSSITASQHFFGKLLGVVFTILIHISVYIILGGLTIYFLVDDDIIDMISELVDISEIISEFTGVALILAIIAIILYSVISAFLGSLATKTEDANKVMVPLVFLAMIGFYIGIFGMSGNTDNALIRLTSYVPFWTPSVMPFRIATGSVGTLELWLTIAGTILFTIIVTWLALHFYKSNVLVYSSDSMMAQLKRSWSINQSNRQARKSN